MKSVLISIRPTWIQEIFDGEKTVEIRKTRPKIEPPFRCYIYCTLPQYDHDDLLMTGPLSFYYGGGKVVGEFVCDAVEKLDMDSVGLLLDRTKEYTSWNPCMTRGELLQYTGGMKPYGWHISDLKIYHNPKPLSDFHGPCGECDGCDTLSLNNHICLKTLKRAPQSWGYVQSIDGE